MKTRTLISVLLVFTLVVWIAPLSCAQRQAPIQGTGTAVPEGDKITVKGKIDYWKNLNDYVIIGEEPPRTYFIVNQDPKIMEELFKSKKTITIEGRRTTGADNIFIEKIDGKQYQGAKEPASK